jgi:hypothetical protein
MSKEEKDAFLLQLWSKEAVVGQLSSASLSLATSLIVAVMAASPTTGGFSTPYRRIIFGLSTSDVLHMIALIIGPFCTPSSESIPLGIGNEGTCRFNGFLFNLTQTVAPMYVNFLCFYYLCKLKYRMNDDTFFHKFEKKIHVIIIGIHLLWSSVSLSLDVFHPYSWGMGCYYAQTPRGCLYNDEMFGKCDEDNESKIDSVKWLLFALYPLCVIGVIVQMLLLVSNALYRKRILSQEAQTNTTKTPKPSQSSNEVTPSSDNASTTKNVGPAESNNEVTPSSDHAASRSSDLQNLSTLFVNETIMQAALYVGNYLLTIGPLIVMLLRDRTNPFSKFEVIFVGTVNPLGGLFNIFIYTRPVVRNLRRNNPELSRIRALYLVIRAGGEYPEARLKADTAASISKDQFGVEGEIHSSHKKSLEGINGGSKSFGDSNDEYRSKEHWSYVSGDAQSKLNVIDEASWSSNFEERPSSSGISYEKEVADPWNEAFQRIERLETSKK